MIDRSVSRRGFIATAAVAAVGSKLALPRAQGLFDAAFRNGEKNRPVRLGVASYSLRNFAREQAIEMTRALGAKYINFKSVHLPYEASPAEFAAAKSQLAAAGLQLVGGGTITFETDTDDGVRKDFEYARG